MFYGVQLMKCPICKAEMKRILYGGAPVFRCFACAGYLVPEKRFGAILRCEEAPVDLLKQEVVNESKPDTMKKIKCPRCYYPMLKLKIDSPASLTIDVCGNGKCGHLWMDGGELARLQLAAKISGVKKDEFFQAKINNLRGECSGTRLKKLPEQDIWNRPMNHSGLGGFGGFY